MIKLKALANRNKSLTAGKIYDIYKIHVVSTRGPCVILFDDSGEWLLIDLNLFVPVV